MFLTLDKIIGEITHKKGSDIKAAALGEPGKQTERIQINKQTRSYLSLRIGIFIISCSVSDNPAKMTIKAESQRSVVKSRD